MTPENLRFVEVYNDLENFHSVSDVARELNIAIKTVRNRASLIRGMAKSDPSITKPIFRSPINENPMSENAAKFMEGWGPEDCIDELRRVVEIDDERVVTRNYFRNHSSISESTWSRYYGTFEEFKRQAGIKLSRQQHHLERQIAKHASVDHYRRLSVERLDYADKYIRENNNRFKTILACSDLHDVEIDPLYLRVLVDTAKRVQPDVISLVGDVFDAAEFGKYAVDPREWNVVKRIKFVHDSIFRPLREACPDTQIDLIEGNHEFRILRQLADATPALRAVLSDLHGFTIGKLLGLDEFNINYIAKADLAAWSKRDADKELGNNYKIYWESVICHHFPYARTMGLPGVNGHHHRHQVWSMFNPIYGAYEWHQLGAGHVRSASYCEGEAWHNGFAIINVDTEKHSVNFDYVPITDFAVSGGKWYLRNSDEEVASVPKNIFV